MPGEVALRSADFQSAPATLDRVIGLGFHTQGSRSSSRGNRRSGSASIETFKIYLCGFTGQVGSMDRNSFH